MNSRSGRTTSEARARRAEATLDAIDVAAIVLSSTGRVLHRNRAAQTLLCSRDGLELHRNQLCANDPSIQSQLKAAIAGTTRAPGSPSRAVALSRPSGKHALQLVIRPLKARGTHRSPQLVVLVGDPDGTVRLSRAALAALYGLTRAEVDIANGLITGNSVTEISRERSVSIGTLRIQIKSIFRKTRTQRQSELVKLLLSLPDREPEVQ